MAKTTQETKGQEVAPIKPPTEFEIQLAEYRPELLKALPAHMPVENFERTIVTAVNQNPELAKADRRSLFNACVDCAQDGLKPDGREAALVIFNTKTKVNGKDVWVKKVQYMPMVTGIIKRMRNSGEMAAVDTAVIYENDDFFFERGDNPRIDHRPTLTAKGETIGSYAIIKLTNGEVLREVMNREEIESVRAISKQKDGGPWTIWWGEMARKTVLRRCAKRAPVTADLDRLLRREDSWLYPEGATPEMKDITPARPTRATDQYRERLEAAKHGPEEPESELDEYTLVDEVGEAMGDFGPAAFADVFMEMFENRDGAGRLQFVENNNPEIERLKDSPRAEGCYGPIADLIAGGEAGAVANEHEAGGPGSAAEARPTAERSAAPDPAANGDPSKWKKAQWDKWVAAMTADIADFANERELRDWYMADVDPVVKINANASRNEWTKVNDAYNNRLTEIQEGGADEAGDG